MLKIQRTWIIYSVSCLWPEMQWSVVQTAVISSGSNWRPFSALFKSWNILIHMATYRDRITILLDCGWRVKGQLGNAVDQERPRVQLCRLWFGMNCDSCFVRSCSKCWDYREYLKILLMTIQPWLGGRRQGGRWKGKAILFHSMNVFWHTLWVWIILYKETFSVEKWCSVLIIPSWKNWTS